MARLEKPGWSACKEFGEISKEETIQRLPEKLSLTRAKKKNIEKVKKYLKHQLPVLSPIGIRRYLLPYHESVLLELREQCKMEVAEQIEHLFEISDKLNNIKPLKYEDALIDHLKNTLVSAAIEREEDQYLQETTILFKSIVFIQSLSSQWLWIAHELFKEILTRAKLIRNDDGRTLNIFKFIYGQFLFHRMKDPEGALPYLNEVRDASRGKTWYASKFINTELDLFRECNILLCDIYHIMVKKCRKINPEISVKKSFEALKCANDSEKNEYIAKAMYELGKSQMAAGYVTNALKTLAKFLAKVKRIPDHKSICNAHKQLAIAHQNLKNDEGARKHLCFFRECANEYQLSDKFAEAHYLTGKYFLECELPRDASPHLKMAFDIYMSLEMRKERDESRFLLGISKGEEVLEEYMGLILDCGMKDKNTMSKLLEWKNRRVPFWFTNTQKEKNIPDNCLNNEVISILFPDSLKSLEKINVENISTSSKSID